MSFFGVSLLRDSHVGSLIGSREPICSVLPGNPKLGRWILLCLKRWGVEGWGGGNRGEWFTLLISHCETSMFHPVGPLMAICGVTTSRLYSSSP